MGCPEIVSVMAIFRQLPSAASGNSHRWCLILIVNRFVAGIVCGVLTGALLVSSSPLWGSPRKRQGHVEGILVDERGKPVGNARVIAYPADRGFTYAQNSGDPKSTRLNSSHSS